MFSPTAELITPVGIKKEAKTEVEIRSAIAEAKISIQYNLKWYTFFSTSYLSIGFAFHMFNAIIHCFKYKFLTYVWHIYCHLFRVYS